MPLAHSKELAARAIEMYAAGKSSMEVSAELGTSKAWVLRKVRAAGVVRPLLKAFEISTRSWPKGDGCHTWRGGIKHHSDGYIEVLSPGHPMAQKTGYILQHRLVMEEKLGRPLLPTEDVHHKNEIRTDNRPENLELMTRSSHMSHHATERHAVAYFGRKANK